MIIAIQYFIGIPLLPSNVTIESNTSSIILSWLPTQFTPDSYNISYSCQLICGLFVQHPTVSAKGTSSSYTIPADPGSNCTISITAVFGSNTSNTVTARNNTLIAGTYVYIQHTSMNSNELYRISPTPCSSYCCSCRTHKHISGEQVTGCNVGVSTLPTPERTYY